MRSGPGWPGGRRAGVTLLFLLFVGIARAFVGDVNVGGIPRRWALDPPDTRVRSSSVNRTTRSILFRLDPAAYSPANAPAELDAVRTAFDQWQAVGGSVVKFEEGTPTPGLLDVNSSDHTNTVFWARTLAINGGRDSLAGILALTYVASFSDGNVIFDTDVVFNGAQFQWFTGFDDPTTVKVFVEAIALHEIGHALGLRHSPVGGATMLFDGDRGVNSQVGLAADELTAVRALYGTSATRSDVGRITGRVAAAGTAIFGAAVIAEDSKGSLVAGTVTRSNGVYELPGLGPGNYTVRTAPLDSPVAANYLIRGSDIASTYSGAQTGFLPSTNRSAAVVPGGSATLDFEVTGGGPLRIVRLLRPASDLSNPGYTAKPVAIAGGGSTVYLGVLTPTAVGADARLDITGDGLVTGPVEVQANALPGLTRVAMPVTVAAGATPGLRSVRLEAGGRVAWAHGFIEIAPPFPDVNFDGLDDRFQRQFWSRFTGSDAAPGADPDGDGFDNLREFASGSNPIDELSANFQVESVRVTAGGATVRSETVKGRRFELLVKDTLPGSDWAVAGVPVLATGDRTEFPDPGATNRAKFYRVRMVP